ncbi:hypothetical protein [Roseovarius aestuariivivens]|uniref:hypothetical protein n=1 Tax=Roseovarius aestuariivivens TaxID=1888910 RepID=UPI0010807BD6|nr:hypothetical protein [Roseovarius aestuariivivens]
MQRQQRWIDYTGLNLIRIVIGSYFMAISLDLIEGSDPRVLFLPIFDPQTADLVTTVLLFSVTAAFMIGLYLRLTSLILAIFMMASSYVTNFMLPQTAQVADFWRDLTLVCAVLLCYSCLRRNEVRKAALVWRRRSERIPAHTHESVTPRRVSSPTAARTPREPTTAQYQNALEPLIRRPRPVVASPAPTSPPSLRSIPAAHYLSVIEDDDEDQPENIFKAI